MAEQSRGRPAPAPNQYVASEPFWSAARNGKLMLQFCKDSGRFQHYPRPVSMYNGRRNLEWREVSGRGAIYTYTVIRTPGPGVDDRLPLVVATIELDEGVRLLGNILNRGPGEVAIGQRVEVAWDRFDDGTPYPAFNVV
jgi:uncharacterized OB-fold protein